jgi:hypothetical protein
VLQLHGVDFSGGSEYRCRFTLNAGGQPRVHIAIAKLMPTTSAALLYHGYITASKTNSDNSSLASALAPSAPPLLVCWTPASNASDFANAFGGNTTTLLEFSANGQQYHSSQHMLFRYYSPSSLDALSPTAGPTGGATEVTLSFNNGTLPHTSGVLLCLFNDAPVPASLMGSEQMRCRSPLELPLDIGLGNLTGALEQLSVPTPSLPDVFAANGSRIDANNGSTTLDLGGDASVTGEPESCNPSNCMPAN